MCLNVHPHASLHVNVFRYNVNMILYKQNNPSLYEMPAKKEKRKKNVLCKFRSFYFIEIFFKCLRDRFDPLETN